MSEECPRGPVERIVGRLREAANEIARNGHAGWGNQMTEAADEIERLREVLTEAVDTGGGTRYNGDHDDCGDHACCMTATYAPHAPDCWVTKARALLTPNTR